ncbi:hypothetical protein [Microbacterium sp. 22242]|uniref:hypothetical protein n=1 Tax=Microbacterium sp. 22242 TaxID=3453896 RepID=UPI003F86DFF4
MHVEPVSEHPAAVSRTLEQWLDPVLAASCPPEFGTRLREIADARAGRAAMWAAFASLGASAALFSLVMLVVTGQVAPTLPWAIVGVVVAVTSVLLLRRTHRWIPRPGASVSTRGPGSLRGGLWAAGTILFFVNVFLVISAFTTGQATALVLVDLGLVLLLVSGFVVPPAILGSARPALRRQAARDPRLMATLERERVTWAPDRRTGMFGPL